MTTETTSTSSGAPGIDLEAGSPGATTSTTAAAKDAASTTAAVAKDQAGAVGSAASSAATEVVQTTKEQVGSVAVEAKAQAKDLMDQGRTHLGEQAASTTQKLEGSVRQLAAELTAMGEGSGGSDGPVADLARTLGARGSAVADFLKDREPGDLLAEARSYAGRKPGTFLLASLAAGLLAGRMTRGAKAAAGSGGDTEPDVGSAPGSPTTYAETFGQIDPVEVPTGDDSILEDPPEVGTEYALNPANRTPS